MLLAVELAMAQGLENIIKFQTKKRQAVAIVFVLRIRVNRMPPKPSSPSRSGYWTNEPSRLQPNLEDRW